MYRSLLAVGVVVLVAGGPALASRCGEQNPPRCGLDSQTNPPDPQLGGTGGCTETNLAAAPVFQGTGACAPGETMVLYDIAQPFPNNGRPGDAAVVGATSFVTLHAGASSPCSHMIDTTDPKPCPDPQLCPDPQSPQPEGAIKVAVTGYLIGCWTKTDANGCRDLHVYTKSACLHAQNELLGPGCGMAGDVDCSTVSTEQIAQNVPGGSNRRLCPPTDPTTSCRGARFQGDPGLRFRIGGFCTTNNCDDSGVAPDVGAGTCDVAWGATNLGYDRPAGKGINQPG